MHTISLKIKTIVKPLFLFLFSIFFFVGIYVFLRQSGILGKFSDVRELKEIINSTGVFSYFVFALIQFLQVTFVPLPASVTTIVGVILFGSIKAFVISFFSIFSGSVVAYVIGIACGNKILPWALGKETSDGVKNLLSKGKIPFFFMMLFPFFPDDILCLIAGVSKMDFKFFLFTNIITRAVGLFCLCFVSGGILGNI